MTHRVDKVSAQVQAELSDVLRGLNDPRLNLATIMDVEVSRDLQHARVRVSTLGGEAEHGEMMAALERARGHVRHELAARLRNNLRRVPAIQFIDDRNTEYAVQMGALIDETVGHDGRHRPGAEEGSANGE
ncbi:MAG: 30S ribosome-binding factor RbfA [Candidatus Dormibacteria bacterium]